MTLLTTHDPGNLTLAGIVLLIVCVGFWLALFHRAE